jgi:hypothetical protein
MSGFRQVRSWQQRTLFETRRGVDRHLQKSSFCREVSNCNLGRSRDRGGEAQGFGSCLQLFWGQPSGGAKTACDLSLAPRQGQRPLVTGRVCGDERVTGRYPYGQRRLRLRALVHSTRRCAAPSRGRDTPNSIMNDATTHCDLNRPIEAMRSASITVRARCAAGEHTDEATAACFCRSHGWRLCRKDSRGGQHKNGKDNLA